MQHTLKNKNIVITGAFGTLGAAVEKAALMQGARVILMDKSSASTSAHPPCGEVLAMGNLDLSNPDAVEAAFAKAAVKVGTIDGVANIAGGFQWQSVASGTADAWDRMYAINVKTTLNACRAAIPYLQRSAQGRIVNIGATAALNASKGMGAYAASKAAVVKLTEALADELKDAGINVNAVLPSIIDTPQNRRDMPHADTAHWVHPDALAQAIIFLLSDASSAITGAAIPVTAGRRSSNPSATGE